ncbi:MAG: hypothetical protein KGN32_00335 [Burkholderiales bacterium]|nr:hypothetical protein [Burkholderiales bacterium]
MHHHDHSEIPFCTEVIFEPKDCADFDKSGNDRTLVPHSRDAIISCKFKNAVYVVIAKNIAQYVGCTAKGLGSRFTKGIDKGYDAGYRWQAAFNEFKLYAWELPDDRENTFAEAVEADVSMLIRAATGHWPMDLAGLSPQHFSRSGAHFMESGRWAMEIVHWLVNNKVIAISEAEQKVLAAISAAHFEHPVVRQTTDALCE